MLYSIKQNIHLLTTFQSLLFMIFLCMLPFNRNRSNRYLFFFFFFIVCGEVGGFLNHSVPTDQFKAYHPAPPFFFFTTPLSFLSFPFLYFYTKSIANNNFRLSSRHLIHLLPFAVVLLYIFVEYISKGPANTIIMSTYNHSLFSVFEYQNIRILRVIQIYAYLIFTSHSLYCHRKNIIDIFSSVSSISLRWLHFFLIAIGLWGVFEIVAIIVYRESFKGYYPYAYILSSVVLLIILTILFLWAFSQREIILPAKLEHVGKYKKNPLNEKERSAYLKILNEYMLHEKPFLVPELTVQTLSDMTKIPSHRISQVLNSFLKINFYDYVNSYRIEESKRLLSSDPEEKKNIIEVVYESGFNSKSTFNSVFKKHTGMTPSQFKNKKRKSSIAS